MDSAEPEDRFHAAEMFNEEPTEAIHPLFPTLHQVVWRNALLTGTRKTQRYAAAHLALHRGVDGIMSAQCLFNVWLSCDTTHDVRGATYAALVDMYHAGDPLLTGFIHRRMCSLAESGNGHARLFFELEVDEGPTALPQSPSSPSGGPDTTDEE
jgi:hypothetical protein